MSTYTLPRPYSATYADSDGRTWQFAYWGSGFIYIRELIEDDNTLPVGASRDVWPFVIDLNETGAPCPEDVTLAWLDRRTGEWIAARNEDIANGNGDI